MTAKFVDRYHQQGELRRKWNPADGPEEMYPHMWLVRGLPGSGKSWAASEIVEGWNAEREGGNWIVLEWKFRVLEADQFFCRNPEGRISTSPFKEKVVGSSPVRWRDQVAGFEYQFDRTKLSEAHAWYQGQAEFDLKHRMSLVVSNTFSTRWEMEPYLKMAKAYNATLFVIDLYDGGCTDEELAARNQHGVDAKIIANMRSRWEPNWKDGNPLPPWERKENSFNGANGNG